MAEASYVLGPNSIELTVAAANTWDSTTRFPKGIVLHSITLKGTAGDILVMRDGGTSTTANPRLCFFGDADGFGRKTTFTSAKVRGDKIYRKPVLCVSECTIGGSNFTVLIEYEL